MPGYDVIIPAWNAERTIGETLQSVRNQTIAPHRIIVVDDGSTDTTASVALAYRAEVFFQPNAGPGAATTKGFGHASGEIVATVDGDDIWLPQKMELQLAALATAPPRAAIFSQQRQFRHGTVDDGTGEVRSGLNRSSLVMARALALEVGAIIDPPGRCGEMVDWLARARRAGILLVELPQVLALRRIIPGSLSSGRVKERSLGYLTVAREALSRHARLAAQKGTP